MSDSRLSSVEIVFATASPRRVALARKIKYIDPDDKTRDIMARSGVGEIVPVFMPTNAEETVAETAVRTAVINARKKGESASALTDRPVLAFDTVVGKGKRVFGKPKDRAEAVSMFETLCGDTHEVVTAVYFKVNKKIIEKYAKTYVTFGAFDRDLVYNYVDSGAPFDKAGGYNIDDVEIKPLIAGVRGDHDNVVGMPVALTEKLIEEYLIYGKDGDSD